MSGQVRQSETHRSWWSRFWYGPETPAEPAERTHPMLPDGRQTTGRDSALISTLQEISTLMRTGIPTSDLLGVLAEQVRGAIWADAAVIRAFNPEDGSLVVRRASGVPDCQAGGLLGSVTTATATFTALQPGSIVPVTLSNESSQAVFGPVEMQELRDLGCLYALALPLHHRGRLLGRLDLVRVRDKVFTVSDRGIASVLSMLVATALSEVAASEQAVSPEAASRVEQVRDNGQRQETARDLDVLEASFAFQQSIEPLSDVGEMLQNVVESSRVIVNADRCYGLLWHEAWEEFTPVASSGADPQLVETLKSLRLSPQTVPVLREVMTQDRPLLVSEQERVHLLSLDVVMPLGIYSAVLVPLRGRQRKMLGALLLDSTERARSFGTQELAALAAIGPQAAVMVENALLYEQVRRSSNSLALVNEIGIDLASLTETSGLFEQVYEHVRSVIDASRFCIGLLVPSGDAVEYRYAVDAELGKNPIVVPLGTDPLSEVIRCKQPVLRTSRSAQDKTNWFPLAPDISPSVSLIAVPIVLGHRVIGVMSAQTEVRGAYAEHQLNLLATIGMQIGVVIENNRLYAIVQERGDRRGVLLDRVLTKQEAERKNLVDDIHNDTLQTLASCLFQIDITSRRIGQVDPEEVQQQLRSIRDNMAENVDRLRRIIFQLRPSTLDMLGLEPALRDYLKQLEQETGLRTTLEIDIESRPSGQLETMLYRIVQEAIDNVRLRSGVTKAAVRVRQRGQSLVVTIADDGKSASGSREGALAFVGGAISDAEMSLMTLKERAELAGGQVRMASRSSGGSTLQIVLPYRSES